MSTSDSGRGGGNKLAAELAAEGGAAASGSESP